MANEIVFYKTPSGERRIEVTYRDEDFWMTQRALANLFAVGTPAINKHLKNIYDSGELSPKATISKMEIVRQEGQHRLARLKAEAEFEVFRERQDKEFVSDFDAEVKRIQGKAKEEEK